MAADSMIFEYGVSYPDGMTGDFTIRDVKEASVSFSRDSVVIIFTDSDGAPKTITKTFSELKHLTLRK